VNIMIVTCLSVCLSVIHLCARVSTVLCPCVCVPVYVCFLPFLLNPVYHVCFAQRPLDCSTTKHHCTADDHCYCLTLHSYTTVPFIFYQCITATVQRTTVRHHCLTTRASTRSVGATSQLHRRQPSSVDCCR
jgi:hypothetical protein